ncbi:MAG: Transcriptional regulator, AcrR family [uncultured Acidimicrobiales bacterium]|uniref:Transcriptional regulator, AcrR family n=1 Tax=uncultured Acidimicrobiales bacterium TaxID=310071 RepID=A0A6J4J3D4_9ACTN|nr:MAG: Transcriptional regulator, AcrR family [uncultured Acidimicrobiales bacterium]
MSAVERSADGRVSTRERLLEAAMEVFWERGYERAGVQEIARRAGLTTGAIYGNFRGKADLLFGAIGARAHFEIDQLFRSPSERGGEILADLGVHLLDRECDPKAGLLVEAFVAARRDPDLAELVRGMIDEQADGIGALVDRARLEGDVSGTVDRDAVVRFSLVLALGSLLFNELGIQAPAADQWSALIRRFVDSLAVDAPADVRSTEANDVEPGDLAGSETSGGTAARQEGTPR